VAALIHDIGDDLAPFNHAEIAAATLRPFVRPEVTWIVEQHGLFQNYYYVHHLGGNRNARDRFKGHQWYGACAAFCERWDQASFDVVTSFRGIWGTTPDAVAELHRVLRPGGRAGITVWGHIKVSPGAWALAPFRLAATEKVDNQAGMVALGRPGAGEQLLASYGFTDIERVDVPFAWEFADPQIYARALAATGPAYEAIQQVGEAEFHRAAVEQAQERLRDGLPLRAEINLVGYLARKPEGAQRP